MIVGSPDEVAEQLREVATELNVGQLMLLLPVRQHGARARLYNTELFAKRVLPQLRGSLRRPLGESLVAEAARRASARAPRPSGPRDEHRAERTVQVNGRPCRVWEAGRGRAARLPRRPRRLPRWTPFLERLARSRRVIVPSLPGFPGAHGHDRLDDLADWVTATLDLLEAAGLDGAGSGRRLGRRRCSPPRSPRSRARRAAPRAGRAVRALRRARAGGRSCSRASRDELPGLLCARPRRSRRCATPPAGEDAVEWLITLARADEAAARLLWPTWRPRSRASGCTASARRRCRSGAMRTA